MPLPPPLLLLPHRHLYPHLSTHRPLAVVPACNRRQIQRVSVPLGKTRPPLHPMPSFQPYMPYPTSPHPPHLFQTTLPSSPSDVRGPLKQTCWFQRVSLLWCLSHVLHGPCNPLSPPSPPLFFCCNCYGHLNNKRMSLKLYEARGGQEMAAERSE